MKTLALAAVAALVLSTPFAATAKTVSNDGVTAVAITARGLDLNSPHQAQLMLDRIDRAALEVCGASNFSFPEYRAATQASACYQQGVQQAVAQLNAPSVNQAYRHQVTVEMNPTSDTQGQ